jgi:hypothetical protein
MLKKRRSTKKRKKIKVMIAEKNTRNKLTVSLSVDDD